MAKATRIDRLIAAIAPAQGVKRLQARSQFEMLAGAYKGASRSRDALSGWVTQSGDADTDILSDLPALRDRSRDLNRNNPIAAGAIHTKVSSVVGTGLKLQAAVDREFLRLSDKDADQWEAQAEREFRFWGNSQDCDVERTLCFAEQQDLVFRAALEAGDHFVMETAVARPGRVHRLTLQHIEADRVCNNGNRADTDRLIAGVRKDTYGAPVAYQVVDSHPMSRYRKGATWTELPAFSASGSRITHHLYRKLRVGQTRGVPDLATVIEPLKQLDRYTDAELDAAVKTALWAMLVKTETGGGLAGMNYGAWIETRKEFYKDAPVNLKDGSSGVLNLLPDDDVQAFNPERPNTAFEPFVQSIFAQIGVALELPQDVITKRFQASYSAARAALMQAWQFFMGRRAWLARNFCQPVYESLIYELVISGRIAAPGFLADPMIRAAYCGAEWIGDAPGQIDETKAVSAAKERIEIGVSTLKRETAALTGEDWEKTRRQRDKELRSGGDVQPGVATDQPSADDLDRADRQEKRESANG